MDADLELESWRRQWQAGSVVLPDLKDRVERETRAMRRFVVGEIVVTVVFAGGSLAWAVLSRRTDILVLALGIWVFTAAAWAISFLLRRDAWAPVTLTPAAFLDLSILRCRRRREGLVAQSALYALILAFDLAWIYFDRPEGGRPGVLSFLASPGVAWVWVLTAALGGVALRMRRKLRRELETLTNLRTQLDDTIARG
jgi:hypothetical protein